MTKFSFALLAILALALPSVWSSEARLQRLRQFNAGQDVYYAGALGENAGAAFSGAECRNPSADAVDNAKIKCSYSGCRVKCHKGYKMGASSSLFLSCDSTTGELTYMGKPWQTSVPPCLPSCDKYGCPEGQVCVAPDTCASEGPSDESSDCPPGFTGPNCEDFDCDPPCQNGGTCIFVDVCDCPPGYWGLLCEKHRCTVPAKVPANASFGGDNDLTTLKVECKSGFKLKSGLTSATFICSHRQWIIPNKGTIDEIDINCSR